jgi:uncharacterized membrane protein
MKILLVASLVLNLLLAGVILGNVSHHMGRKHFGFKQHEQKLVAKLPPEKQRLFRDVMGRADSEREDIRRQIGETRERALSILIAPEFDERAFQVEVEKLQDLRGMIGQRLADATRELAKQFDSEERKVLGGYLKRPPPP